MTRLTVMCLSFIVVSLMFFGIGNAKIDPKSIAGVRTGLLRKHSGCLMKVAVQPRRIPLETKIMEH